jgi:hypothetical protein
LRGSSGISKKYDDMRRERNISRICTFQYPSRSRRGEGGDKIAALRVWVQVNKTFVAPFDESGEMFGGEGRLEYVLAIEPVTAVMFAGDRQAVPCREPFENDPRLDVGHKRAGAAGGSELAHRAERPGCNCATSVGQDVLPGNYYLRQHEIERTRIQDTCKRSGALLARWAAIAFCIRTS